MGERSSMALHWKILIGLALGVVIGAAVNLSWDMYTWGALGVGDPASYRASKDAQRADELPDNPGPALDWLNRALDEYVPSAGAVPARLLPSHRDPRCRRRRCRWRRDPVLAFR